MIGKQILNYEILSVLGEGGMGTVYLAKHISINRKVAIKVLRTELAQREEIRKRFKNEAAMMAHLQHPNIVSLIDYLEQEDGLYLIMEYIDGKGLDDFIKELHQPLPIERAKAIFKKILSAFSYAHKNGIIHRDVKPSNILLTANDEVKVLDFGIAKLINDSKSQLTKTGTNIGTVYYMSPEQVKAQELDQRSDIYSLGVTFYEILSGFCPYSTLSSEYEVYNSIVNENLVPLTKSLGSEYFDVWQIILKATYKNKNGRYNNCDEIIADLDKTKLSQHLYVKPEINKPEASVISQSIPSKKKNNLLWFIVSCIVLALGILLFTNYKTPNIDNNESVIENTEKAWVLREEHMLRSGPHVSSTLISKIPFGSEIELLNEKIGPIKEEKFFHLWQKVRYNGQEGWIAVEIDSQPTVGTFEKVNQLTSLWGGTYNYDAEYALVRKWAHYAISDFLDSKGWSDKFQFKFLSKHLQSSGYRSVLKYHFNQDYSDKERYDYVIFLESTNGGRNLAFFCKADPDGQGGQILGWCKLPVGSAYLGYTKIESMYDNDFQIGEIIIYNDYEGIVGYLDDDNYSVYYTSVYYDESQYGC